MASTKPEPTGAPTKPRPREDGPFVLRPLLEGVPLSADGATGDIQINCVEYLDGNLYVGTSASELLHFVQIPPDPADKRGQPSFILASRLKPAYSEPSNAHEAVQPGVQQILLLPLVGKACVLCNWTVTFYTLPELSPVFGSTQVKNCNWVGGVDLNEVEPADHSTSGVTILLSLNRRIQVVRIGEDARVVKKIDFAGSTISVRRDSIACVADSRNYALLDIDRQQKIPLMTISSLDNSQPAGELGQAQNIGGSSDGGILRSNSSAQPRQLLGAGNPRGHARSTSLGDFITGGMRRQNQRQGEIEEPVFREPTPPAPSVSPFPGDQTGKPLPPGPSTPEPRALPPPPLLRPHIVSPTAEEFLLVTGTRPDDAGIGIFVNLDGDPTRPTIEFEKYPRVVVVDGGSSDLSSSRPTLGAEEEGYILASMTKDFEDGLHHGLEIQRWDAEGDPGKYWLETGPPDPEQASSAPVGVRSLLGSEDTYFHELTDRLCQRKFTPFASGYLEQSTVSLKSVDSRTALSMEHLSQERELFERDADSQEDSPLPEGWEAKRNSEEEEFVRRLARTTSRIAVWSRDKIWWAVRNPLLLQLESGLQPAAASEGAPSAAYPERGDIFRILGSFRGRDARTELEFMTFGFVRQQAGILLLIDFLDSSKEPFSEAHSKGLEDALTESGLDPRVVLALIPGLRNEIMVSRRGIWIFGGVRKTAQDYLRSADLERKNQAVSALDPKILQFARRFLTSCRRKKGFGSVADETDVSKSVDAALLLILLELDQHAPKRLAKSGTVRTDLYELVDNGVDCFDRAVSLLESYRRLYVLSRLYQSRKMAADVLATWRRIIEGERDDGGEFKDGELRVREYLMKVSSQPLVEEYGLWLAARNPKLGVQVFADKGKAPAYEPSHVVAMLKEEAPDAVKYYLEHLVFGKGQSAYVNDLITYYLDIVITDLKSSQASRDTVAGTYNAYRALQPPKPTYRQFLTDNAPEDDEVWHSRLRLLQLLGGPNEYDAAAIRSQVASLPGDLLVPETIILSGREHNHGEALRLLVHGLGDYDTAVAYCLRGGASIYSRPEAGPADGAAVAAARRRDSAIGREQQAQLFGAVLGEFLAIEDVGERAEQTGALLERFGAWFDVGEVLGRIPDGWGAGVVGGFLVSAVRRVVEERQESAVARALSSAENLRVNGDLLDRVDEKGPTVEAGS